MDISGDFNLQNAKDGFFVGNNVYHGININGVTFNINRNGVVLENIPHASPLTEPSVTVSYCLIQDAAQLIKYDDNSPPFEMTEYSPYAAVYNNTAVDLFTFMIDDPIALIGGSEWVALSSDYMAGNVLIRVPAISNPANWVLYDSPQFNAYLDVTDPYIGDPANDNIIVTSDDFLPDGITPKRDSPMNHGDGYHRGSIPPFTVHEGNLNYDDRVDMNDYDIAAKTSDGDLPSILPIIMDWQNIESLSLIESINNRNYEGWRVFFDK